MSTTEDEKIKNWYNENMKEHLGMDTRSPQGPPGQDIQVQEVEEITSQVRKVAFKKRIKYDMTSESSKKWKFDPLNTRSIQEELEKRKQDEFLHK